MQDDEDYKSRLASYKAIALYVIFMGISVAVLDVSGLQQAKLVMAGLAFLGILFGLYKTFTFKKYFNRYWEGKGLDAAARKEKWRETFPYIY